MSYWRIVYTKKEERGYFEIITTTDQQKDRWLRILKEDPENETVVAKVLD